ncbi:MAG TPA: PAS domain S-box protein, partial [Pyrinomonadaceae bacterium]|nr:PAS domain S-box protein [Pyrinomonadaceae bacterium]
EGLYTVDTEGKVTSMNPAAEKLFGWTFEELKDQKMHDVTHYKYRDGTPFPAEDCAGLEVLSRGDALTNQEDTFIRKDGTFFNVIYSSAPIREGGEITGLVVVFRDMTERNRTQEALRRGENRLRAVFNQQFQYMAILAPDGTVWEINETSLTVTGIRRDAVVGKPFWETDWFAGLPEMQAEIKKGIETVSSGDQEYITGEGDYFFSSGELRKVAFSMSALRDDEGDTLNLIVEGRDITENKRAEQKLRESELRMRELVEALPVAVYTTDAEGNVTHYNEAAAQFAGRHVDVGKDKWCVTYRLYNPDGSSLPHDKCPMAETLRTGKPVRGVEAVAERPDGTRVYFMPFPTLTRDADGKVTGGINVLVDISERKQAEETRARLAAIVESSDDAIISKDLNGIITSWNRGAENIFGYSAEEAVGRSITMLIPDDHSDEEPAILARLRRGESIDHYETVRRCKDGTILNISLTVSPVFNADGKVIGASKIARDITESKQEESNRRLLFDISETIRRSENKEDMLYAVAAATGMHFGASRCLFNEIDLDANLETVHRDYFNGVDSVAGTHRISDYSPITTGEMANGKTVVNCDAKTDERTADDYERTYKPTGERAYVAVPLLRNGQWTASLWISDDKPRIWTPQDISLLETVAERMWLAVEKLKSESALRESVERYRTLFDLVPVAVYTCDADGVISAYNQNSITLWGREPEPGEKFNGSYKMYDPDGRPLLHNDGPMARVLRGEKLEDGDDEILIERPDRARKVVIALPKPFKDERGNITGGINCLYDVTELKIAQRALIRAERRAANDYQALLQHIVPLGQTLGTARDLITIYRAIHEFIRTSMNCSAFFVSFYSGQTRYRTAAYAWGEGEEVDISILPPMPITPGGGSNSQAILERKSVVTNRYWDTMKERPHVVLMENAIDPMSSLVVPMIIKDSVIGTLEVQAHENRAFSTEHVVAMEMVANLAAVAIENVRLLEEHDKARQEAEAANRTKDEFLSVLSHELRTPLNSMMGWIRMLRLGNLDADHTAKAIEVIDRNTRVQSSLIEDLLDVSRIISGKMRVETELTDLAAAIKTATEGMRPIAIAKKLEFEVNTGDEPLLTDGDPVRLQQVVTNLVQNAIKFTPEHGRIDVLLKRSGTNAILEVSDTGIGIEKELQLFIFERFRQGDASTKRGFAGLGLGLTIVRTIVELHGGVINVQSEGKDRGTLFTITLPLSEVLYSDDGSAIDGKQPQPDGELEGTRILLVDDDLDSLKPLQLFLEGQKASVAGAQSAAEALTKLTAHRFDIMITDIGMPAVDGFELISKMRSSNNGNDRNLPAIAVTAYASPGDRERAFAAGFQAHLAKPVNFDEVLSAVKRVLGTSKAAA